MPAAQRSSSPGAGPRTGALPNLLIIGAQKCGTSALHYYLDLHPEIGMSAPKELNFFRGRPKAEVVSDPEDREVVAQMGGERPSLKWYRERFDPAFAFRGEASPAYTAPWFPEVPGLIAELLADVKLIMLVRDPFEQVPSGWRQNVSLGFEPRPLAEAIRPGGLYVARIRYRSVLTPYLERFGHERILVVAQADLLHRRRETMRRVFSFIGADPGFYSPRMERERHVSAQKGARKRMLDRFQRSALARPAFRLPQEVKWYVERAFAAGSDEPVPELDERAREIVAAELADDVAWLASEFGIETGTWLR
jgi:hypothetical protein